MPRAQIKPEIFVNFKTEPGPNPNPTRKIRPDLQLRVVESLNKTL